MKKRLIGFVAMTIAVLALLLTSAAAQMSSTTSPGKGNSSDESIKPRARQVIASASGVAIRFSCLGELVQMRLEVIGLTGEVLFDSDFKSANLIDWSASDNQGRRVADGSYLCVVTVKDSAGQITRKQAIASLRDQSLSVGQSDGSLLTPAQAQTAGSISDEDVSLTILEPGQSPATAVLAHDSGQAHLVSGSGGLSISSGDFFANKVTEHIRLTAEGNVGIGISNPHAKLDVAGLIRASEGIVFPDGSIQFSAAQKTFGAASLMPFRSVHTQGQNAPLTPDTSGTGTTGKVPKWQDGPNGVLNDSNITEVSGAIGINGTPNTNFRLDVNGSVRFKGSNPGFNLEGLRAAGNIWLFQTVDDDGRFRLFSQDNANPGVERLTIGLSSGNVGIGTANPAGLLHVRGGSPVRILGDTTTLAGTESVDFMARSSIFNSDLGGMRIQRQASGNIDTLFFAAPSGGPMGEMMRVRGDGRVGIGTTTPGFPLTFPDTLGDKIALWGQSGNHYGFGIQSNLLQIHTNNSGSDIAFGYGSSASFAETMRIKGSGNVGIGTTAPTARLHVLGSEGAGITGVYGEGSVGVHGFSTGGLGVRGVSPDGWGVRGDSTNGYGVRGLSTNSDGVVGSGLNGVHGIGGASGTGVWGENGTGTGVKGSSGSGFAVAGYTTDGTGVYGDNGNSNTTGHAGYFNGRVNITGNLFANNLAGGKFSQQHTTSGNPIVSSGTIVDAVTITAPDRGVLFISAFVNIVAPSSGLENDFFLQDGGGAVLTQTTEEGTGNNRIQRTAHLSWMLRVDAGQSVTIRTVLNRGETGHWNTQYYDHNLSVVYLRSEY